MSCTAQWQPGRSSTVLDEVVRVVSSQKGHLRGPLGKRGRSHVGYTQRSPGKRGHSIGVMEAGVAGYSEEKLNRQRGQGDG